MSEEKDFFQTCLNIVASLEVTNESQAIAKELVLSEVENLPQENKKLNGAIQTYDILLKANVEENKQLKAQIKEYQKALDETMSEKIDIENNWNKLKQKIIDSFNKTQDVWFIDVLQEIEKIEQGSDSDDSN